MKYTLYLFFIVFIFVNQAYSLVHDFTGQISTWDNIDKNTKTWKNTYGARYLPKYTAQHNFDEKIGIDLEASLNAYLLSSTKKIKPYRYIARFTTSQSETRVGLQMISFGPSLLLRSLRWFDQIDINDPLQFTTGVKAFLYKYNFLNNSNVWLWALCWNNKKGNENTATKKNTPEFGGRFQAPLLGGEFAGTTNFRQIKDVMGKSFTEKRLAIDGRWDVIVGLWFEAVISQAIDNQPWTKTYTLGADYTFAFGNGLYSFFEHQYINKQYYSAYSLNYSIGILDSLNATGTFSWNLKKYNQLIGWKRTYDNWVINLNVYRNQFPQDNSTWGAQLMVIFYY